MARVGQMRRRLTIQSVATSADSGGGRSETYSTLATVWGTWTPLSSQELYRAGIERHVRAYESEIRYRSDVTSGMRAVEGSTTYEITGIRDADDRKRFLVLILEAPLP